VNPNKNEGKKQKICRRKFLQWGGRLSTTALTYNRKVHSGIGGYYKNSQVVVPQDNLIFDEEMKVVSSLHPMHCGGACLYKIHIKNDRAIKLTSAGDILRENSKEADESISPIQRRPCLKGITEIKRVYAPDRLKYPLIQTKERGDLRGFKKISWDEATDIVANWLGEMRDRQKELGYLPILVNQPHGVAAWRAQLLPSYLGSYITGYGNTSSGNREDAVFIALTQSSLFGAAGNPAIDILNSKFIINWGCDHQTTRPQFAFYMTKAKEKGIPIITIDPRLSGSAIAMSTGLDDIPAWVAVKPGTDAAMLAAMANVIYRKNLHDKNFIDKYCFGFYKNDRVISQSPAIDLITQQPYYGQEFKVPEGASFVEYLDSLQLNCGGYEGVLKWAEFLTTVPASTIESLAIKYATIKPACIHTTYGGGAQRTDNGMYFCWLTICISAMTGNAILRGGGHGEMRLNDGDFVSWPSPQLGPLSSEVSANTAKPIMVSGYQFANVILTGRDDRTANQFRDDVKLQTGIDLGKDAKVSVEMYYRGAGCGNQLNQLQNITKNILAWKKLKYSVSYERFMTPTAAYSDIICPVVTNFEECYLHKQYVSDVFVVNKAIEPLYDCRKDYEIDSEIAKKLGIDFGLKGFKSDEEVTKWQWENAKISDDYKKINPNTKLPLYEEILKTGNFQFPIPLDKVLVGLSSFKPGRYFTDTGKINFYSPFLAKRKRAPLQVYTASYVRPRWGYEDILDGHGKWVSPYSSRSYTLQFMTPRAPQRAHSTFDNVAALKDKLPHTVKLNPKDAADRNIKDGDIVYVYNDWGCIKLPAEITKRVMDGVILIEEGTWYRPSSSESFEAYIDIDGDGIPEKHLVPIDIGGNPNSITPDWNSGSSDPLCAFGMGTGMVAGGNLCEISKYKP
jgi:anaerobic dimethyl sulfoxide reductase subunit A